MKFRPGFAIRSQRIGPAYTRCPRCRKQVSARSQGHRTVVSLAMDLKLALAEHNRSHHPEQDDDDDDQSR